MSIRRGRGSVLPSPIESLPETAFDYVACLTSGENCGQAERVDIYKQRSNSLLVVRKIIKKSPYEEVNREIRLLRDILGPHNNSHISKWITSCEDAREIRLYTEYCCYGDLDDLAERYREQGVDIPESLIWHILFSAAKGLAFVHFGLMGECNGQSGLVPGWNTILHRDIKPANIFMQRSPNDHMPIIKIGDFGHSGMLSDPGFDRNQGCGTAIFLPPEAPWSSTRGDVWGLGSTITFLCSYGPSKRVLTGYEPFGVSNLESFNFQQVRKNGYSHELAKWIGKTVKQVKAERIDSLDLVYELGPVMELLAVNPAFQGFPSWAIPIQSFGAGSRIVTSTGGSRPSRVDSQRHPRGNGSRALPSPSPGLTHQPSSSRSRSHGLSARTYSRRFLSSLRGENSRARPPPASSLKRQSSHNQQSAHQSPAAYNSRHRLSAHPTSPEGETVDFVYRPAETTQDRIQGRPSLQNQRQSRRHGPLSFSGSSRAQADTNIPNRTGDPSFRAHVQSLHEAQSQPWDRINGPSVGASPISSLFQHQPPSYAPAQSTRHNSQSRAPKPSQIPRPSPTGPSPRAGQDSTAPPDSSRYRWTWSKGLKKVPKATATTTTTTTPQDRRNTPPQNQKQDHSKLFTATFRGPDVARNAQGRLQFEKPLRRRKTVREATPSAKRAQQDMARVASSSQSRRRSASVQGAMENLQLRDSLQARARQGGGNVDGGTAAHDGTGQAGRRQMPLAYNNRGTGRRSRHLSNLLTRNNSRAGRRGSSGQNVEAGLPQGRYRTPPIPSHQPPSRHTLQPLIPSPRTTQPQATAAPAPAPAIGRAAPTKESQSFNHRSEQEQAPPIPPHLPTNYRAFPQAHARVVINPSTSTYQSHSTASRSHYPSTVTQWPGRRSEND